MVRDSFYRHGGGGAVLSFLLGLPGLGLTILGGIGAAAALLTVINGGALTGGALLGSTMVGMPFAGLLVGGLVLLALASMLGSVRKVWKCSVCGHVIDRA